MVTLDEQQRIVLEPYTEIPAREKWLFDNPEAASSIKRGTGKKIFYRFSDPADDSYPYMLELFSRAPELMVLDGGSQLTPIPVGEEVSSRSTR